MPQFSVPRRAIASVVAIGAVAVIAAPSVAATNPLVPGSSAPAAPVSLDAVVAPHVSVRHMVLNADGIRVTRKSGSYVLRLTGVAPDTIAVRARARSKANGPSLRLPTTGLPRVWYGRMGFKPNLAVTYTVKGATRTHYLRGLGRPSVNAAGTAVTTTVPDTPGNAMVIARMRPGAATNVRAVFEPSPIRSGGFTPGKADPAKRQAQAAAPVVTTNTAGYIASSPNAPFTLPYTSLLGNGGQSWQNVLSANGQYTQGCETFGSGAQSAGDATTLGQIQVYETAAEVQQALSVSGAISYGNKMARVALDGGYSTSSAQSTSSFYAVAMVSWQGATVNLGNPQIASQYSTAVSNIQSFSDALGMVSACGDSYPTSYQQGAVWASILQITLSSSSAAQEAYANLEASYGESFSGSAKFNQALSSTASSASIIETDECWGPAGCGAVPGYSAPGSTVFADALNTFTGNYNIMYANLASMCAPTINAASCLTEMYYAPIQEAIAPGSSFSANSPRNLVTSAAEGVYGVLQNLQAWSSQYQALITANPGSPNNAQYQSAMTALNQQATACGLQYLQSPACSQVFQGCYSAMTYNPTYIQSACMPTAFTRNPTLATVANPFDISGVQQQQVDEPAASTELASAHRARTAGDTEGAS